MSRLGVPEQEVVDRQLAEGAVKIDAAAVPAERLPGQGHAVADLDRGDVEAAAAPVEDCRHARHRAGRQATVDSRDRFEEKVGNLDAGLAARFVQLPAGFQRVVDGDGQRRPVELFLGRLADERFEPAEEVGDKVDRLTARTVDLDRQVVAE